MLSNQKHRRIKQLDKMWESARQVVESLFEDDLVEECLEVNLSP